MKSIQQHRHEFESYYQSLYVIRRGAYGIASKHLDQHDGVYISEHALTAWTFWLAAALENCK